jgi:hypothetical protein
MPAPVRKKHAIAGGGTIRPASNALSSAGKPIGVYDSFQCFPAVDLGM